VTTMSEDDFKASVSRLERAIEYVEKTLEGQALEASRSLVRAILEVHKQALTALLAQRVAADAAITDALPASVQWLFALHELNPVPLEARVKRALAQTLGAFPDAAAELVDVAGERVRVRLAGGPARANELFARAFESTLLELAPECQLEIEGLPDSPAKAPEIVPVARLLRRREESLA
jgi:hypothetical protein